jgi:hypothetical protein
MRDRYLFVVATIAASALGACSDEAVDQVTAPPSAATPVQPVTALWPSEEEIEASGVSSAIGIQITLNAYFDKDPFFVVEGRVQFQWANDVSATIWAWLLKNGSTINSSEASMHYQRFALPVASGDTTFVVRISTNNITCGLIGKSASAGSAKTKAIDARIVEIVLWQQDIGKTNGPDVLQPSCPPGDDGCGSVTRVVSGMHSPLMSTAADCEEEAPAPPGGGDPEEVCYDVWRELWYYDFINRTWVLWAEWYVGTFCYYPET